MRPTLFLLSGCAIFATVLTLRIHEINGSTDSGNLMQAYKARKVISCSPDWDQLRAMIEESSIPPLPGSGNLKWPIKTNSDSAQFYFNQGINTYYGFHIIESRASFLKAAKFDSTCAMVWWGVALSFGPNINDVEYPFFPEALDAVAKAIRYSGKATPREKLLIQSQEVRYSGDSSITRDLLNQRYADKMKALYQLHPKDAEIAALYADALMLQHPWDLWLVSGQPRPWTPEIRQVIEKGLAINAMHPGLNHYYIHVMEPSPWPGLAKKSADRLGKLTPGLAHLVHMPSHIYLRTGQYKLGVQVNENAVNTYKNYTSLYAPVTGSDFLYAIHNLHMQANHAMMAGDSAYGMRSARATQQSIPADYLDIPGAMGNLLQYIYMTPVLADVRFGNWKGLLSMQAPSEKHVYAKLLYHFGRGMAAINTNDRALARQELQQMQELMKDSVLYLPFTPFSAAIEGAIVAEALLKGSIDLRSGELALAIAAFEKAVTTEEKMVYNEPRDWLLNPKHYLGDALLKSKKYKEARAVYQRDLATNNENGWALYGLYKAYLGERNNAMATRTLARATKAFTNNDLSLASSVHQ
jgi:tetratricopeptide (TPR) repeat protein